MYPEEFILRLLDYLAGEVFSHSNFKPESFYKREDMGMVDLQIWTIHEIYWFYLFEKEAFNL